MLQYRDDPSRQQVLAPYNIPWEATVKRKASWRLLRLSSVLFILPAISMCSKGYRADSLKVTEEVRAFVATHHISGSDRQIVHKIIEITDDPFLFVKTDRPLMKSWIRDPVLVETFKAALSKKQSRLAEIGFGPSGGLLSAEGAQERRNLLQEVFFDTHNLRVYDGLLKHKKMRPEDTAFVVSGSEAIQYRVRDGCTTMAHVFIALAKAAGLKDVRFVVCANVSEFRQACPLSNRNRLTNVEIDGHMVALAKIDDQWALVNCTYFEPYSLDEDVRYEILTAFEGKPINPGELRGKILRLPSFQKVSFPPSELLIVGVGSDPDDDLDVENHIALMNLSVSGDPNDLTCRWILPSEGRE
jgi:hypothetical protein